jgi:hypothetical protein
MNLKLITGAIVFVVTLAVSNIEAVAETDAQVAARKTALELAGAFSNAGFKIRDGHWSADIRPGEARILQVNLFAGNQYWFSVGATQSARKMKVTVFDEKGKMVESQAYAEGPTAAAGFEPDASGPYYVRIEEIEGEPATFCLLYSYQ